MAASEASIVRGESGELRLAGVLDYRTGPQLREAGRRLIRTAAEPALRIDCAEVERSSSVGVSLLLAFQRDAAAQRKSLAVTNLPADMREIARVSGILDVLPIEEQR